MVESQLRESLRSSASAAPELGAIQRVGGFEESPIRRDPLTQRGVKHVLGKLKTPEIRGTLGAADAGDPGGGASRRLACLS